MGGGTRESQVGEWKGKKRECDEPSVGLQGESDREASESGEASDGRNKERQINTCPKPVNTQWEKGLSP